jgi:hypothetical protein
MQEIYSAIVKSMMFKSQANSDLHYVEPSYGTSKLHSFTGPGRYQKHSFTYTVWAINSLVNNVVLKRLE